jgi:hypothetical protein
MPKVVLEHEGVQAFDGLVLVGDDLSDLVGGLADRLFDERQEELVLSAEVLVEAV